MWQLAVAAALAGSGFFATRIFNTDSDEQFQKRSHLFDYPSENSCDFFSPDTGFDKKRCVFENKDEKRSNLLNNPSVYSCEFLSPDTGFDKKDEKRFNLLNNSSDCSLEYSSPDTGFEKKGGKWCNGKCGKSECVLDKQIEKRYDLLNNSSDYSLEFVSPDIGVEENGGKWEKPEGILRKCGVLEKKKKSGKGFGICVKKRRISKFGPGKCDSCSSKGNSSFSRGIGVGIMCMMSAGKEEINKLSAAMDETAKVVHELKFEISKRKASHNYQVSSPKLDSNKDVEEPRGKDVPLLPQSSAEFKYNVQNYSTCVREEGESEVEPQGEVVEMDLLEAELESELQKLSWSPSDSSVPEERRLDSYENDASAEGIYERDCEFSSSFLSNGVTPSVLKQKLCNLLIKQQEGQIMELETELHQAQSKLHEREAELQSLKDCVRRMSQFSLESASDQVSEKQVGKEKSNNYCTKIGSGEPNRPLVGMKRAMSFGSHTCHLTSHPY